MTEDVNRKYLRGIGSKLFVGDQWAWLGVDLDPKRTKIDGQIVLDKGETSKVDQLQDEEDPNKRERAYKDKENDKDRDRKSARDDPNESQLELKSDHRNDRSEIENFEEDEYKSAEKADKKREKSTVDSVEVLEI